MSEKKILLLSLVAGVVALVLVQVYLSSERREMARGFERISVVVASRDVPSGQGFSGAVSFQEIPRELAPDDVVTSEDHAVLLAVGVTSRRTIPRGSLVMMSDVLTGDARLGSRIPDQKRAITIPINPRTTVPSLLQPGDLVDIKVVAERGELARLADQGPPEVKTIGTRLEVLAVGSRVHPGRDGAGNSVTVLVTTDDADRILRGMSDLGSTRGVTLLLIGDDESRKHRAGN